MRRTLRSGSVLLEDLLNGPARCQAFSVTGGEKGFFVGHGVVWLVECKRVDQERRVLLDDLDLLNADAVAGDELTSPELVVVLEHHELAAVPVDQSVAEAADCVAELVRGEAGGHVDVDAVDSDGCHWLVVSLVPILTTLGWLSASDWP